LELTSDDVIHSFWVPQLQVKTDQIPGITHYTWLEADEPGRYRGQCAEFCGLQHTKMAFVVVAEPREDFDAWVAHEAEPSSVAEDRNLTVGLGLDLFMNSTCVGCHTIRGTEADAIDGPDLTHLMTREIIGGFFANGEGNLRQFVRDPHALKHGVFMPPSDLSDADLDLLIGFLRSLD
jgi:cytochrome c oxidase subunit 2